MQRSHILILVAGTAAALLSLFPYGGLLFLLAPFIPLLLVGLTEGSRSALHAAMIAAAITLLIGGENAAINFCLFIAMPCCFFLSRLLRHRLDAAGHRQWYPTVSAISDLTLLTAGIFMMLALAASQDRPEGLETVLKSSVTMDLSGQPPEAAEMMRQLIEEWSFLLFGFLGWLWVLLTWGLALFSNKLLTLQGAPIRQDLSLTPGGVTPWVPALMLVSLFLALMGGQNDAFSGKVVFILLLLPYFLSGMAAIHIISHRWQPRNLWLFLIYIVLFFKIWVAGFVALGGIYLHLREVLDKRQKIG